MARVVIEHLTKDFPGDQGSPIRALDDISLTVEDKEFLVLVGPSGCGKTTLLRLIAGLEQPTRGTLTMDGRPMNGVSPTERNVAMVFQHHALYPHMSVYENMAFGLKLRKVSKVEIEQRVRETAELLGITECLARKPAELSGGERQRAAVGRAIVRRPEVLLFDEPLSNLDLPARLRLRAEISRLHARLAATIIYVTHDQQEAMTMGQRMAVLRAGTLQQVAEPVEIYKKPTNQFVAGFVGSPPMNFFEGMLIQEGGTALFLEAGLDGTRASPHLALQLPELQGWMKKYMGKKVVLGIRPENIALAGLDSDPGSESVVEAVVELVEPLGSETYLRFPNATGWFTVRVAGTNCVQANQKVPLVFDMAHAYFFDPETRQRLSE